MEYARATEPARACSGGAWPSRCGQHAAGRCDSVAIQTTRQARRRAYPPLEMAAWAGQVAELLLGLGRLQLPERGIAARQGRVPLPGVIHLSARPHTIMVVPSRPPSRAGPGRRAPWRPCRALPGHIRAWQQRYQAACRRPRRPGRGPPRRRRASGALRGGAGGRAARGGAGRTSMSNRSSEADWQDAGRGRAVCTRAMASQGCCARTPVAMVGGGGAGAAGGQGGGGGGGRARAPGAAAMASSFRHAPRRGRCARPPLA